MYCTVSSAVVSVEMSNDADSTAAFMSDTKVATALADSREATTASRSAAAEATAGGNGMASTKSTSDPTAFSSTPAETS